jgi:DHA1 family tetracycline resistance protein-like MFS transporter
MSFHDPLPAEGRNRGPILIVVVAVALNSLGIGLVLPVMPTLLLDMGVPSVAQAAAIGGLLSLVFASMQFLFGPLLGSLSDRYGRRPVLIASLMALALDYALLAIAGSLWLFFVARAICGVASATFTVANAVLSDLTPPEKRAANFGLTGAAFGLGFVLGPVFGGVLGELGPRAPFIGAGVLSFANAVLAYVALPETLRPENRRAFFLADSNPFAIFVDLFRRPALGTLVGISFLDNLSGLVYPAVWAYFAIVQFGWNTATVGLSLAAYGACFVLIQAGLIRIILKVLGEMKTACFGLSAGVIGFVILTQLSSGFWAFLLTPLFALRAVTGTALTGLLSRRVSDAEQGKLQGILSGMTGLATLIGIPLMTQTFAFFTRDNAVGFAGAPFLVAALLSLAALALLLMQRSAGVSTSAAAPSRN